MADVRLDPDTISAEGRYLIRGSGVCTARVSAVTESWLEEGTVRLTSDGGLFFSGTPGAPAASALTFQTNGPPGSVDAARDFWLGATNSGPQTLTYELLDPYGSTFLSTNLAVEAVMVKLATNAYYVAYGSAALLGVDLAPVSYDPSGYLLYLDGELCDGGWPQWYVDTSCLTAGVHTLTVQSWSLPGSGKLGHTHCCQVIICFRNRCYKGYKRYWKRRYHSFCNPQRR